MGRGWALWRRFVIAATPVVFVINLLQRNYTLAAAAAIFGGFALTAPPSYWRWPWQKLSGTDKGLSG